MELNFQSLLIISFLAFAIPILLENRRLAIPLVVAEILAGIIVGKSGLNIISQDVWIEFLSTLGFAYLMFTSGLEIDFSSRQSGRYLVVGSVIFLLTLAVSYGASLVLVGLEVVSDPILLVLILSTTSLGVVTPILKEKGLFEYDYGQTILNVALIADFISIFLITIYFAFTTVAEGHQDWRWVFLLFAAFYVMFELFRRISRSKVLSRVREGISQIEVRGSFFLILFFVALSEVLGSEIILGAFMAGIMASLLLDQESGMVQEKLDAIGYGFLIPIFFIMVGVNFDLRDILNAEALLLVPLLLVVMYLVKVIPALVMGYHFGFRKAAAGGVLLSARLSLIIASTSIAADAGLISDVTSSSIILVALLTTTISPAVFNKLVPRMQAKKEFVLIIGANEYTFPLKRKLQERFDVKYYEQDEAWLQRAQEAGLPVIAAGEIEQEMRLAAVVVAATKSETENFQYCLRAKELGVNRIGCLIYGERLMHTARENGFEPISPEFSTVAILDVFIRVPHAVDLLDEELAEITVLNAQYIGKPFRQLTLFGDGLVLKIFRGERSIIPHGETRLKKGDIILFNGSKENVQMLRQHLGTRDS